MSLKSFASLLGLGSALLLAPPLHAGEGLIAHYTFDEGFGTALRDLSGAKNDAVIHGAKFVRNGEGFALQLDGVDDYVDCGSGPTLNLKDKVSVEAWVCPEAVPTTGEPGIVGKAYGSYGLTYYTDGQCWWYISGGPNNCHAPVSTGSWHHVVGTFDGVTLRLYVDGRLAASQASRFPTIAEGQNLFMGKSAGEVRYTKNAHFKGMVDEVRIYNRPLSPEEVQKHYRTTNLTRQMGLRPSPNLFGGELIVGLELRGLGELPAG
ncbi:MAG: LamG domain-containing protein, partial [Planctomycetes bacterium]|nr:LamG domain-containing protein [Planctomycetota bacterium]